MSEKPIKWGYILSGKYRPDLPTQERVMKFSGIDMSEEGTCWTDILPDRATRPRSALKNREALSSIVRKGDTIMVMNLMCLGNSPKDIEWFTNTVHKKGASFTFIDTAEVLEPGTNYTQLIEQFAKERNSLQASASIVKAKRKSI